MPASFRVTSVDRVFLYPQASQSIKHVAVAPQGTVLRGDLEVLGGEYWLCIDLADAHPLRSTQGLGCLWVRVGDDAFNSPLVAWVGPTRARSVGHMLDVQWERPFSCTGTVRYELQMRCAAGGPEWDTVWSGGVGEEFGTQRIEVTVGWPYRTPKASLRILAVLGDLRVASLDADVQGTSSSDPGGGPVAVMTTSQTGGLKKLDEGRVQGRLRMLQSARVYSPSGGRSGPARHVLLQRCAGAPRPRPRLSKALVMGPYHTCTTAMALELERCLGVPVVNRTAHDSADRLWKHRAWRGAFPAVDADTLVVLMVKEPHFWIKSLARNFYEIHPLEVNGAGDFQDRPSRNLADLFGHLEHDRVIYPDASALWSDAVAAYLDESTFPGSPGVVVRSEDFLFRFADVMSELAMTYFSSDVEGPTAVEPKCQHSMKSGARSREQALSFYSDSSNRFSGFSHEQLLQVAQSIPADLIHLLGYGKDAVASWTTSTCE
mmetsp:Transcript_10320/g.30283  ORF Transcript_10320/g.30283 Transcript_10320/m.30283 type:complete len:489 (-) Transcript_10320:300-1766(-)|eukprot:CAMPEP_0168380794 /NCGR_PEP_ID=MMETSP0228-20121227/12545_1 /TAXON_ID=133427 /ORGANISM="Protoceratium reticulatum, Strain CCCM 535 (=CCMP 1889)" /LENGTH=488 /DNA_ID=CAMNT_0008393873 /DNA_START=136 /DNA_END=1602 /DNA_ORIENTATION=+